MKIKVKYSGGNDFRIISVDGKELKGSCRRCGKCCQNKGPYKLDCPNLVFRGDGKAYCTAVPKPVNCALGPLPDDILPGCGYSY